MKKLYYVLGGLALVILIILFTFIGTYNSFVTLSETVDESWAQVENQYQRRYDLIPSLVNTVKGSAAFQKETQLEITQARSSWTGAQTRNEQIAAAGQLDSAISRLLVVAENYPQLDSSAFNDLQVQLEGTENRIAVERMRYNEAVKTMNVKVKRFPSNIIASMFGFEEATYFEIEEGVEQVPQVIF